MGICNYRGGPEEEGCYSYVQISLFFVIFQLSGRYSLGAVELELFYFNNNNEIGNSIVNIKLSADSKCLYILAGYLQV